MNHTEAFELLVSRPEWLSRCLVIAHHHRNFPERGAEALRFYANGQVMRDLEESDDFWEVAGIEDPDIDWLAVFRIFLAISQERRD